MTQARLTSLALLAIEKKVYCKLYEKENFTDDIINTFVTFKDRRLNLTI